MILLTGAGLLLRSLWNLENVKLGLEPDRVVTAKFTLGSQRYRRPADQVAFFYLGEMVEVGAAAQMFTSPRERRTQEYITGRFG